MCDTKANLAYEISVLIAQMTLCEEMSKGVAKWWVTSPATEIQRQVPDPLLISGIHARIQ